MKIKRLSFLFFLVLSLMSMGGFASHIKGGQVHYKHISGNTVEITFTGYRDTGGVEFGNGFLDFGDGSTFGGSHPNEVIPWNQPKNLGNGTEKWSFNLVHTYASSGGYLISYNEENRNGDIANAPGSINIPFYVESLLILDPLLSSNSSAINRLNPVFIAPIDNEFQMSLDIHDPDDDSLSYSVLVPLSAQHFEIGGYLFPSDASLSQTSTSTEFVIDRISGNLFWGQPSIEGEYLVAIKVKEWRKINGEYTLIGYTTYDFNFEVLTVESPPKITLPELQCKPSEEGYSETIYIDNPNSYELNLQIETKLDALKINGISVADWNEDHSETSISTQKVELLIEVDPKDLALYPGFNSVLMNMSFVSSEIEFKYTPVFNVGVNCIIPEIVTSTSEIADELQLEYSEDHVQLYSNQTGPHQFRIFNLSGIELFNLEFEAESNSRLISYPFQLNTVYLIFVQNSSGNFTQKITFK